MPQIVESFDKKLIASIQQAVKNAVAGIKEEKFKNVVPGEPSNEQLLFEDVVRVGKIIKLQSARQHTNFRIANE